MKVSKRQQSLGIAGYLMFNIVVVHQLGHMWLC